MKDKGTASQQKEYELAQEKALHSSQLKMAQQNLNLPKVAVNV
jgi:hypothetical protein